MLATKKTFFDFFSPPNFLEIPSPGLSMTESGIRLVEFERKHPGLILKKFAKMNVPEGSIVDGKINESDNIIKTLEDFRKRNHLHYIRTMIPDEGGYLYRIKIPKVDGQDLRLTVESTIEENVPLTISESVFDFNLLREVTLNEQIFLEIAVSVISKDVVKSYLEIFTVAGYTPIHFETESQSIAKALVPREDNRTYLLINFEQYKIGFYIVFFREVAFSSVLPVRITSIAKMKDEQSKIKDELEKIVLYWQTLSEKESRSADFEEVIICGKNSFEKEAKDFFSSLLKKEVKSANVLVNAFSLDSYIPEIPYKESVEFAASVGLALSPDYIKKDV